MISKIIFGLFSIIMPFQINPVYGLKELPVITIEFTFGDTIDLDKNSQMIRGTSKFKTMIHNMLPLYGNI